MAYLSYLCHQVKSQSMKQTVSRPSSLRFRRWSRKAYAAFASIGRHVTIGCVSKSIADKSLTKQASAKTVIPYSKDGREPKRGEDSPVGNRGSTAGLYPADLLSELMRNGMLRMNQEVAYPPYSDKDGCVTPLPHTTGTFRKDILSERPVFLCSFRTCLRGFHSDSGP